MRRALDTTCTLAAALASGERGQTLVEYGLILVVISLAALVAMGVAGTAIESAYGDIADQIAAASGL